MTQSAYNTIFEFLNTKIKKHPKSIVIDFEISPILVLKNFFKIHESPLFFHFSQSFIEKNSSFEIVGNL
jgi:hypothetical protein